MAITVGGLILSEYFFLERIPNIQYFLIFGRPDVFITYFSNWGYLKSVKIKEGINNSNLLAPGYFIS
jgi:hypothetical protein